MQLIGRYQNSGFEAVADDVMDFFNRRQDLQRPLFREVCPDQELFVMPVFNLQRYAPGEGFRQWHSIGRLVMKPPSRCTACWPGSFTAILWMRLARGVPLATAS